MGYFTNKNIANVVENKKITLAHNPNFVTFSTKDNRKVPIKINLTVGSTYAGGEEFPEAATFSIVEKSTGIKHTFRELTSKEISTQIPFCLIPTGLLPLKISVL